MNTEGDAYPCCWSTTSFGNIQKTHILDIWNSDSAKRFRHDLKLGHYHRHCSAKCPNLLLQNAGSAELLLRSAVSQGGNVSSNAQLVQEEFWAKRENLGSSPLLLGVFPTNRCGLKCGMCSIWASRPKSDYGVDQIFEPILDRTAVLEAVGGEPLMSKKLLSFLSSSPERFPYLKYGMITNGLRLADVIHQRLLPTPDQWEWVGISLDSFSPNTLSGIRHGLSVEVLQSSLQQLLAWSEGICRIAVLTVVMRSNLYEIEKIAEKLEPVTRKYPNLRMSISIVHGTWLGLSDFSCDELHHLVNLSARLSEQFPFVLNASTVELLAKIHLAQADIGLKLKDIAPSLQANSHDLQGEE